MGALRREEDERAWRALGRSPDRHEWFGSDGITGHPDHIRVGAATDEAFDLVAAEPGRSLHWLVHGALPQTVFERWNETRRRKGLAPWDPDPVYDLRGVPDELTGVSVDTSSVAHRVVAGLREHPQPAARHRAAGGDG